MWVDGDDGADIDGAVDAVDDVGVVEADGVVVVVVVAAAARSVEEASAHRVQESNCAQWTVTRPVAAACVEANFERDLMRQT